MKAAAVLRIGAGEDIDQRRLAGAVLAEQRLDLAGTQIEVDRIEREHAWKALGDALQAQELVSRRAGASSLRHKASVDGVDRLPVGRRQHRGEVDLLGGLVGDQLRQHQEGRLL